MADEKMRVKCPYDDCGQGFKLGSEFAGKKVKCAKCRRRFITPTKPGEPCIAVETGNTGGTRAVSGALEPVTKGTSALEPLSGSPPPSALEPKTDKQEALEPLQKTAPAAKNTGDDFGLALDQSASPAPSVLPPDDDMSLAGIDVSKPRKPTTGIVDPGSGGGEEMSLGLAETPPTSSGPSLSDLPADDSMSLAGIDVSKPRTAITPSTAIQDTGVMELGLDSPASSPSPVPVAFGDDDKGEDAVCKKCKGPIMAGIVRCPTCGTKVGASEGPAKTRKKIPIFKIAALLLLSMILYAGYWVWDRTRLVGVAGAFQEGKKLTEQALTNVVGEETAKRAVRSVAKAIVTDRIVVAVEGQLQIEEANKPMRVRQGQPMIQKKVVEGRANVIVKTPNGDIQGWVPEAKVTEVVDFDRADLLGSKDKTPHPHSKPVADLVFKPDGKFLSSIASNEPQINIWLASKSRLVRTYQGHHSGIVGASFLTNGSIVSSEAKTGAKVWDPLTTATLRKMPDFKGYFRPFGDGNQCLEILAGQARVWDLSQGVVANAIDVSLDSTSIRLSRSGTRMIAKNAEGELVSIALPDFAETKTIEPPFTYTDYDISPDGVLIAFVPSKAGRIVLLDSLTGEEKAKFSYSGNGKLRFCGTSAYVAVASAAGDKVEILHLSRALGLTVKKTLTPTDGATITAIAPAPSGNMLGVGYSDGSVEVHNLQFVNTSSKGGSLTATISKEEKTARRNYEFVKQFIINKKPEVARMYYKRLVQASPDSPLVDKAREELAAAGIDVK